MLPPTTRRRLSWNIDVQSRQLPHAERFGAADPINVEIVDYH
jgi:hypothetical protein